MIKKKFNKTKIIWLLYTALFIYNLLDAYQTKLLLEMGAKEINPLINYVLEITETVNSLFVVKIIIFAILGFYLFIGLKKS